MYVYGNRKIKVYLRNSSWTTAMQEIIEGPVSFGAELEIEENNFVSDECIAELEVRFLTSRPAFFGRETGLKQKDHFWVEDIS